MKLLLTGSTGLIGSALQRVLQKRFPDLTITTPMHQNLKTQAGWDKLSSFDYIIHAAGYAAPAKFLECPMDTVFVNTTALAILLTKLNPNGRLLFLSSSEVYSGSKPYVHTEDEIGTTNPASPRGVYIESKRCGEALCRAARQSGTCATIARVSLAYGPGVKHNDKRVMSELIDLALKQGHITLKDGGQARRAYGYVDDIAQMLINILMEGRMELYNVGGKSETTIFSLAQKIADMTEATIKVPYKDRGVGLDGAPQHVALSMNRYIREFGEPEYTRWNEGLARTIAWHRELLKTNPKASA